jgi:peroxiredoxin
MKNLITLLIATATLLMISATLPFEKGYEVGDTATDFSLKNIDGNMVSLSDYPEAKGYIVIFTCNTCPYSVMYEDRIIELHNKWAGNGYPVIAINPNDPSMKAGDSYEDMQHRASEKDFPFPYLFDEGQEIFPQYGATRTPHVFVLNKDKVVKYIGAIDDNPRSAVAVEMNYIENAISAIESGTNPDPSFTKAIGCGIKYKS